MESLSFLQDIYPPGLLYARTIRSPIAKGFLKFIQVPVLPENYTLITARNIPGVNKLEGTSIPILADKTLSYIGEPVALLVGNDKTRLEELAASCVIYYDEEKPVFSCADSDCEILAKREIVFPGRNDNTEIEPEIETKIISSNYTTGIQDHWYAEPTGAVAYYDDDDAKDNKKKQKKLFIRTATQWPFHVKRSVISLLALDQSAVCIAPTSLNLHMDGKLWYPSLVSCHAALGAYVTKKAVRLVLNREEDFFYSPKRSQTSIDILTKIDEEGNNISTDMNISVNLGAYGVNTDEILDQVCLGALGLYKTGNLKVTAAAKSTNIPPQGPFSGFGLAQGLFARECHVSKISAAVNKDPADWRLEKLDPKVILPSNSVKSALAAEELIKSVTKMSDYYRKWSSNEVLRQSRKGNLPQKSDNPRGIGIAVGFQGNSLLYHGDDKGVYQVEVTLTKESILEIKASIATSEDYIKIWERVVLETMSIKPEMVRIASTHSLDSGPSCSSRNITAITKLVEKCCLAIRKQRFHDPLPITVRRSIKPQSGALWDGRFTAPSGKVLDINGFIKPGLSAAVVEVSVDLVQCIPVIRGVWLSVDGGKIISKNRAKRNLTRGAAVALGWAFTENIGYKKGSLPKTQYDNFKIFSPVEIPPIHINFLEGEANGEPKGIGDLPSSCIPAAFLQAVSQAMGFDFTSIPLKRKDIWNLIRVMK